MQAINHTVTGGLIALTIRQPALVAPLALVSHFVLDVIPHYGSYPPFRRGTQTYYRIIALDGVASIIAYNVMVHLWPQYLLVISLGVFFSLLPDLLWPLALYVKQRGPLWAFFRFHKGIQHESGRGIAVEVVWFWLMIRVLAFLY
jgi:hypothetical protein